MDDISSLVHEGGLDNDFTEARPSSDWGMIVFDKDKMVCNKYEKCVIPLHEKEMNNILFLDSSLDDL